MRGLQSWLAGRVHLMMGGWEVIQAGSSPDLPGVEKGSGTGSGDGCGSASAPNDSCTQLPISTPTAYWRSAAVHGLHYEND